MHYVVVVAHPSPDGYAHALAAEVERAALAAGNQVTILDLYRESFNAAMTAEEWRAYAGDNPIVDPQVAAHAELVKQADALVFVYPTWWSGAPSILKGWLDRVLVAGVAFHFDKKGKVRPSLTNVRHIIGITTSGSKPLYIALMRDNGRRMLGRALRLSCGWRTRTTFLSLRGIHNKTDEQRERFLARVGKTIGRLK
jgi:putative NADPH-quinone reductase